MSEKTEAELIHEVEESMAYLAIALLIIRGEVRDLGPGFSRSVMVTWDRQSRVLQAKDGPLPMRFTVTASARSSDDHVFSWRAEGVSTLDATAALWGKLRRLRSLLSMFMVADGANTESIFADLKLSGLT